MSKRAMSRRGREIVVPLAGGRRSEISMNSTLSPAECRARGVCETCGGLRNGRMRMPRTTCGTCGGSYVQRHDGRPNAHKRNGEQRCPGGGGAA